MANKNSLVFYTEWFDIIKKLAEKGTAEDVAALCDGIKTFVEDGEEIDLPFAVEMAFCAIKNQINRDTAKYEKTSQKRKEAINKRWNADTNTGDGIQTDTNVYKTIQTSTNDTDNDNEDDDEDEYVDEDVYVSSDEDKDISVTETALALPAPQYIAETDPKKLKDKDLEAEFDSLWKFYPRRVGKKDAMRHYFTARKEGIPYDTINDGLFKYVEYCRGQPEKYIMQGSTWFCGHHWEDDRTRHKSDIERLWDL